MNIDNASMGIAVFFSIFYRYFSMWAQPGLVNWTNNLTKNNFGKKIPVLCLKKTV